MVAIHTGSVLNGSDIQTVVPNYYANIEETYGCPIFSVHRVDLHDQLKALATGADGPGRPCKLHVRATAVDYVSCASDKSVCSGPLLINYLRQDAVHATVTVADGTVWQADLIIAANGVHSTAREHVLGTDESLKNDTGWATMRWLVPTEELLADPHTAPLVEDSSHRYFVGARGGGFVWYPCRKYV